LARPIPSRCNLKCIVAHEDWLPTFAAVAGNPNVKEQLLEGVTLNGRSYKNHIDGYNQLAYLKGSVDESPREGFIYVNDCGSIAALRYRDWKATFLENRARQLQIWLEPF
jgi:arylsulfatase A-like enzyme